MRSQRTGGWGVKKKERWVGVNKKSGGGGAVGMQQDREPEDMWVGVIYQGQEPKVGGGDESDDEVDKDNEPLDSWVGLIKVWGRCESDSM